MPPRWFSTHPVNATPWARPKDWVETTPATCWPSEASEALVSMHEVVTSLRQQPTNLAWDEIFFDTVHLQGWLNHEMNQVLLNVVESKLSDSRHRRFNAFPEPPSTCERRRLHPTTRSG